MSDLVREIMEGLRVVKCWRCQQPTPIAANVRVAANPAQAAAHDEQLCRACFKAWLNGGSS